MILKNSKKNRNKILVLIFLIIGIGYYYKSNLLYFITILLTIIGVKDEGEQIGIKKGFNIGYDEGYQKMQEKIDL